MCVCVCVKCVCMCVCVYVCVCVCVCVFVCQKEGGMHKIWIILSLVPLTADVLFIWLGLKLYSLIFERNYAYSQTTTKFEIKL